MSLGVCVELKNQGSVVTSFKAEKTSENDALSSINAELHIKSKCPTQQMVVL